MKSKLNREWHEANRMPRNASLPERLRWHQRHARVCGASSPNPAPLVVSAADPLNFRGILTPDERVPANVRRQVRVA